MRTSKAHKNPIPATPQSSVNVTKDAAQTVLPQPQKSRANRKASSVMQNLSKQEKAIFKGVVKGFIGLSVSALSQTQVGGGNYVNIEDIERAISPLRTNIELFEKFLEFFKNAVTDNPIHSKMVDYLEAELVDLNIDQILIECEQQAVKKWQVIVFEKYGLHVELNPAVSNIPV